MKDIFPLLVMTVVVLSLVFYGLKFVSDTMSDEEVIEPAPGVKCVVVSRMFNTSVDCWKED